MSPRIAREIAQEFTENLVIKDLNTVEEMLVAHPLIDQMHKGMDLSTYKACLKEMIEKNDFKMIAIFDGDKIIGACGYWIFLMLYCGRYIQISNLVVDEKHRSMGVGKKIMQHIEKLGKKAGCEKFILESYTENKKSHSLYYREGFYMRGFHFMKDL